MKDFSEILYEDIQGDLVKKVNKLKGGKLVIKGNPTKGGGFVEIAAFVGKAKVGNLWVRDHGGTIGLDFSEPSGIFLIDEIYMDVRKTLEGRN